MAANPVPYNTKTTLTRTDRKGYKVELIVVHETAGTGPGDLNWLIGSGKVSVNWYIDRAGNITCLDPAFGATAHAGYCRWGAHQDENEGRGGWGWSNLASEGIEVSGPNTGLPFTPAQLTALHGLVLWRLDVYGLDLRHVVRHLDIAWPKKPARKTDPEGLDWSRFLASLQGPPAPPSVVSLGGAHDQSFKCSPVFRDFYDAHGGLLVFGFPTGDQYDAADLDGEQCQYMNFENLTLKNKPSMPESWRLRPILLREAIARTKV